MSNTVQALEGLKVDPSTNTKMDTSLEHTLPKQATENSNLSCSSSSDSVDSNGICQHKRILSQDSYDNCLSCGVYVPKNGVKNFKSAKGVYSTFFPPKTIYETLTRRTSLFNQAANPEYIQIRQTYVEWILELSEKLRITYNSSHLAILLLDTVMFKDASLTSRLQIFAPICLLIAAKTIELDERIPYIPKLRRYAGSTFSVEEFSKAELYVLDLVDWNPQFSTAIELTEFLMCQGFLFSSDIIANNNTTTNNANPLSAEKASIEAFNEVATQENTQDVEGKVVEKNENTLMATKENSEATQATLTTMTELEDQITFANPQQPVQEEIVQNVTTPVQKQASLSMMTEDNSSNNKSQKLTERKARTILTHFETSYAKLATYILRDAEFIEYESKVVASSILAFFRNINKVTPSWNDELEAITHLKFDQISRCVEAIQKKYTTAFDIQVQDAKLQNVLFDLNHNNKDNLAETNINKVNNNVMKEKIEQVQPQQPELKSRTNLTNNAANANKQQTGEPAFSTIDPKLAERKPAFNYQSKNAPTTLPTSYNYIRDDLRFKTKSISGTANTEIPLRNPMKNALLPPSYQAARSTVVAQESFGARSAVGSTEYSALTSHTGMTSDAYAKRDSYAYKDSTSTVLSGNTHLTSENRLPYHVKGTIKK